MGDAHAPPDVLSSPSITSPDVQDDDSSPHADSWRSQPHSSPPADDLAHSQPKQQHPMQKRRRVTRACDECRRKKIKCDGRMPCTHCTVYSYDCTYDQPSNRRRNPTPQYIEAIENRLQRAEMLLKKLRPDVDLSSPTYEDVVPQKMHVAVKGENDASLAPEGVDSVGSAAKEKGDGSDDERERDSMLESMVATTGQLDLDDEGHWDFHGHSSGIIFLTRMRQQFGNLLGSTVDRTAITPFMKSMRMSQVLSPKSASESPFDSNLPNLLELPPRDVAKELVSNGLDMASALMRFVHKPSFYASFDKIYDTAPEDFGSEESTFLALLYVVLALGCLFGKSDESELEREGYETAIHQGFKYFKAGRQMIEITECRDLVSLQTVVVMVLFLQSSAKLSTCYSFIGIAQRAALRMGLHRAVAVKINPIEREVRKRVFWIIWKMDNYISALLGLPKSMNDDDIDQEFPLEIQDEYITKDRILPMPAHSFFIAASNAHSRLVRILNKVIKHVYPIKGLETSLNGRETPTYLVSHARIEEIEKDLQDWMDSLPPQLKPGGGATPDLERVQHLLRIAYAHTQMVLYRPFLHYVSQDCKSKSIDKRSYARAAACVSVARNIIHITTEMKRRNLLIGAYWFAMYTTFFAILSLVYYVSENPDSQGSGEIFNDAKEGRDTLASLAKKSLAADRCTRSLGGLFEQWPSRLGRGRSQDLKTTTKRQAPSRNPSTQGLQHNRRNQPSQIPTSSTTSTSTLAAPIMANAAKPTIATTMGSANTDPFDGLLLDDGSNIDSAIRGVHDPFASSRPTGLQTPDSTGSLTTVPALPTSQPLGVPPLGPIPPPPSLQQQQQQQPPPSLHFPLDPSGLPDLNAMMFPSTDPFVYPNQPPTSLDSRQPQRDVLDSLFETNNNNNNDAYMHRNPAVGSGYDDLEGQLFGPLPPYLTHGQGGGPELNVQPDQCSNIPGGMPLDLAAGGGGGGLDTSQQDASGINFDAMFDGDDFNNLLLDPNFQP